MSVQKQKNYRFKVRTLYVDEDLEFHGYYIRRASRKNVLYIYVYEKSWLVKDTLLLSLKVTVYE